ncbi:hypothetical protein HDU96_008016 [Phlyctochytrium bullatum]|nr:hypothetical protein HDU96_008016 [Phlyctochytrium bullatum]
MSPIPQPASTSSISPSNATANGTSSSEQQQPAKPAQQQATTDSWSPSSWRTRPIVQDVPYPSTASVDAVTAKLRHLPPLVSVEEVRSLRKQLAEVAEGKRFLLQGGDCAELFEYCNQGAIEKRLKVLLQMSLILVWGGRTPVVRIARMAGQYAKPRSKPFETLPDGTEVPAFRGDNVNSIDVAHRTPDPTRLLDAYFHSAATLNFVRSTLAGGFADLHHPDAWNLEDWDLAHVRSPQIRLEYQTILDRLHDSLDFMRTIGGNLDAAAVRNVDLFVSHEGLLLDYEEALTRPAPVSAKGAAEGVPQSHYNLGTHFLWIGDRTRQIDGAHVEFFRGLANPIGVKVGPSMKADELKSLLDVLDPHFETGKVTLITRYGAGKIAEYLPGHIKAVQETNHKVVWCCDPMHGNTVTVNGIKTRRYEDIVTELGQAFRIHDQQGSHLGGVHFELTGDRVTETIGGSMELGEVDLERNYQTFCDPRLNYEQSLDVAFSIAKYFQQGRSVIKL